MGERVNEAGFEWGRILFYFILLLFLLEELTWDFKVGEADEKPNSMTLGMSICGSGM